MIEQISSQLSTVPRLQETAPSFLNAAKPTVQEAAPADFSNMISQMIADTASALHQAEATSVAAIHGKASVQDVVETVMSAEQSLQAAIAVRDKVTAAYLELSRMAI